MAQKFIKKKGLQKKKTRCDSIQGYKCKTPPCKGISWAPSVTNPQMCVAGVETKKPTWQMPRDLSRLSTPQKKQEMQMATWKMNEIIFQTRMMIWWCMVLYSWTAQLSACLPWLPCHAMIFFSSCQTWRKCANTNCANPWLSWIQTPQGFGLDVFPCQTSTLL